MLMGRFNRRGFNRGYIQIGILLCLILVTIFNTTAIGQDIKRVGIVYSESSANKFFDKFAYSQLYMAMQHQAMMAGIPYDLLSEDDLTDISRLLNYDALIFPSMSYLPPERLAAIEAVLFEAVYTHRIGIITSGDFLTQSTHPEALPGDPYSRMKQLLGLSYAESVGPVESTLTATDINHPVMRDYVSGEQIQHYDVLWFNSYTAVQGQSAVELARLQVGNSTYNGVLATVTGGRNVHFANDQLIGGSNLVWSALEWVVFGEQTPVGLNLGRDKSIFISRNDMDQSMFAYELPQTDIPLYDLLVDWKTTYNYVGSYYINIGNKPEDGQFTDWSVSAPLYRNYIALGNEIGTHSWTHPSKTADLDPVQLEFEFNQSKLEIGKQLGNEVIGAAIPGDPETLAVDRELDRYLNYISGRSSVIGPGYLAAFGYLAPDFNSIYFSLNLSPDYTLIDFLGFTAAQAKQVWENEYAELMKHASQPIIHWLWHDYGPTIEAGINYSVDMYTDTIEMAFNQGAEFTTLADIYKRIKTFESAILEVSENDVLTVNVAATDVGRFSLKIGAKKVVQSVDNWYAYDVDRVFLPKGGGVFTIHLGSAAPEMTRIISLPMRSTLISTQGDGIQLDLTFEGEGKVIAALHPSVAENLAVHGADRTTLSGNILEMDFVGFGSHTVSIMPAS